MNFIANMLDGISGVIQDWKEDFKEDAKKDWKLDWDYTAVAPTVDAGDEPVITGTVRVGQTLTVSDGVWVGYPEPALTYAWAYSASNAPYAWSWTSTTTNTFVPVVGQVGGYVYASVTGTNEEGTFIAESAPVGPILAA
jgi:hypothetical protein